jgi:hypothetical protein
MTVDLVLFLRILDKCVQTSDRRTLCLGFPKFLKTNVVHYFKLYYGLSKLISSYLINRLSIDILTGYQ